MSDCMTQEDAENMNNEQAISILVPLRDMLLDQNGCPISDAFFALNKAILALSAQPERKKGQWITFELENDKFEDIKCSACGKNFTVDASRWCDIGFTKDDLNFCPSCGADMRGDSE